MPAACGDAIERSEDGSIAAPAPGVVPVVCEVPLVVVVGVGVVASTGVAVPEDVNQMVVISAPTIRPPINPPTIFEVLPEGCMVVVLVGELDDFIGWTGVGFCIAVGVDPSPLGLAEAGLDCVF